MPPSLLKELHRLRPGLHFAVLFHQAALAAVLAVSITAAESPLVWVPLSLLLGLTLFNFTVLLHEVVHGLVWRGRGARFADFLGWLYALASGISRSQFTRWHLDHHSELGTSEGDPKRHHLSPKRNARWLKALYFTPALFAIYFRAAAKETAGYPAALRRKIAMERSIAVLLQITLAAAICRGLGMEALLRLCVVPYLVGFPAAFGLNRLGQHYDVDPRDPARWGTRMRRSLLWDWAFLWSGYHLEHHYFPAVPFYNLRKLNRALEPFFERRSVPARSYGWLFWRYFVLNRPPHALWT